MSDYFLPDDTHLEIVRLMEAKLRGQPVPGNESERKIATNVQCHRRSLLRHYEEHVSETCQCYFGKQMGRPKKNRQQQNNNKNNNIAKRQQQLLVGGGADSGGGGGGSPFASHSNNGTASTCSDATHRTPLESHRIADAGVQQQQASSSSRTLRPRRPVSVAITTKSVGKDDAPSSLVGSSSTTGIAANNNNFEEAVVVKNPAPGKAKTLLQNKQERPKMTPKRLGKCNKKDGLTDSVNEIPMEIDEQAEKLPPKLKMDGVLKEKYLQEAQQLRPSIVSGHVRCWQLQPPRAFQPFSLSLPCGQLPSQEALVNAMNNASQGANSPAAHAVLDLRNFIVTAPGASSASPAQPSLAFQPFSSEEQQDLSLQDSPEESQILSQMVHEHFDGDEEEVEETEAAEDEEEESADDGSNISPYQREHGVDFGLVGGVEFRGSEGPERAKEFAEENGCRLVHEPVSEGKLFLCFYCNSRASDCPFEMLGYASTPLNGPRTDGMVMHMYASLVGHGDKCPRRPAMAVSQGLSQSTAPPEGRSRRRKGNTWTEFWAKELQEVLSGDFERKTCRVYEDPVKGRGIRARVCFVKGQPVLRYFGRILSDVEYTWWTQIYGRNAVFGSYVFSIKYGNARWIHIDATSVVDDTNRAAAAYTGRLARLVNHSRLAPNLKPKLVMIDGKVALVLRALTDIEVGQELAYDYSPGETTFPWMATS